MGYGEAFLYGAVQGLTEFLPISSSAHLILLPKFLRTVDPGLTFDVFLHLGTLVAIFIYFRRDWLLIFRSLRGKSPQPVVKIEHLVIATMPALIAGVLLHEHAETVFRGPRVLVWTLALGGLVLYLADKWAKRQRGLKSLSWRDALAVGVFQCFALVPGVSRSGATITAGRLLGFTREAAARFAFLIAAPVTGAAVVWQLKDWPALTSGGVTTGPLIVAFLSSVLFGWLAIDGLLRVVRRFSYLTFALYRLLLAGVIAGALL